MTRVKVFKERKSLLIELLDNGGQYYTGFYHMIICQLALFVGMVVVRKILLAEGFSKELNLFGHPKYWLYLVVLELVQLTITLAIHPLFKVWVVLRGYGGGLIDAVFASSYLLVCLLTLIPLWRVIEHYPTVIKPICTLEHMRLVMKSYSFIRENAVKVLRPWTKDDRDGPNVMYNGQMSPTVGSFYKYAYFLFAPTLLYRDHYPRLKSICWTNVGAYLLQFFILSIAISEYIPSFMPSSFQLVDLTKSYCFSLLLSIVTTWLCSLVVLHTWLNAHAELTTFADRQFYTDWWNSTSYSVFYRKWNVPVYDWLNIYIYQDLNSILKSRWICAILVFFLSSIMHDYHMTAGTGHFLPVLLILFTGCGGVMYLVRPDANNKLANLLTIAGLFVGVALIMDAHITEVAARSYCKPTDKYLKIATLDCF